MEKENGLVNLSVSEWLVGMIAEEGMGWGGGGRVGGCRNVWNPNHRAGYLNYSVRISEMLCDPQS